jgi:hypothetical protein
LFLSGPSSKFDESKASVEGANIEAQTPCNTLQIIKSSAQIEIQIRNDEKLKIVNQIKNIFFLQ